MLNSGPHLTHGPRRPRGLTTSARLAGAVLAGALVTLALTAAPALAGTYVVTACGAAPGGVNNSWAPYANHANVTAYGTPCAPISGGLIARAAANGQSAPVNAVAGWTFTRPSAETLITNVDISAELYRTGGDAFNLWTVGLYDNTGTFLWGGGATSYYHSGTGSGAYLPVAVNNRTSISVGVGCANGGGCTTASSGDPEQNYSRARTALFGARVTLYNSSSPTSSDRRGQLWTDNAWIGGTQPVGFDAADDIGVRRIAIAVDSDERASDSTCDYTRTVPCPGSRTLDTSFNTAGFSDGTHTMYFRATDASGNVSTDSRPLYIDNTAPAAPATPQLAGAPSANWRTVNGFTLNYANPSTANGSPNSSSEVQVCPIDEQGTPQTTSCTTVVSGTASGTNSFNVPAPGKYKARVRVNDRLYSGAWSDWGPVLRFDNIVPGEANPQIYNEWLSEEELADGMKIEPVALGPKPASGYAGYAIRTDGVLPTSVANATSDVAGRATVEVASWSDGIYTVRARAVSAAGLAAADPDVATSVVKIDTAPPTLKIDGAPTAGSTVNYAAVIDAASSDTLSGIAGADAGKDVMTGAYIAYSIDGAPEVRVRGAALRLTALDGRHTFAFSAVDVAGNRSAERSITFTQDTSLPQGGMLPLDPNDLRRIAFFVTEECIASATIELTTNGGADWRPLDTEIAPRLVSARVPDDIWDARTPYSVRARVTDCAGNASVLDRWYGGAADGKPIGTLTLPQRVPVRLTAAFTRLELTKACVTFSKPRVVRDHRTGRTRIVRRKQKVCPRAAASPAATAAAKKVVSRTREVFGVLTDATGTPLANRDVQVQTQPKAVAASWQVVRVQRTDRNGVIRATIRKFTSLRIRLVAPHDEAFADGMSQTLTTHVAARSTITADHRQLRNGDVLRLTGRVQGGNIPAAGMQIALYGFSPSKRRWLPVRTTVQVDPRGNWAAVYRFTATGVKAAYRFRVRIAERATFPFATGYSRTVSVTVRP